MEAAEARVTLKLANAAIGASRLIRIVPISESLDQRSRLTHQSGPHAESDLRADFMPDIPKPVNALGAIPLVVRILELSVPRLEAMIESGIERSQLSHLVNIVHSN